MPHVIRAFAPMLLHHDVMKTPPALSPKAIEAHFGQVVLADPRTLRLWYLQEEVRDAAEAMVRSVERRRALLKEHAKQRSGE